MIKIFTEKENPLLQSVADSAFEKLSLSGEASVELIETDEEQIRKVNAKERGVDKVTDVLSFPMLDKILPFTEENYPFDFDRETGTVCLGSILVCGTVAERQAKEYGHGTDRETAYLFLHGLLHLLGYDHEKEEEKALMREKEETVLTAVGLTRQEEL